MNKLIHEVTNSAYVAWDWCTLNWVPSLLFIATVVFVACVAHEHNQRTPTKSEPKALRVLDMITTYPLLIGIVVAYLIINFKDIS